MTLPAEEESVKKLLLSVYKTLLKAYGPQQWWPADSIFEIMIGAILTQNTQWFNVKKAIRNLKEEKLLEPRKMRFTTPERLASFIVHTGYYNVKAKRIRNLLDFLMANDLDFYKMKQEDTATLREKLLAVNGIGPETADSILLYALDHQTFVIDAYTRRLFSRLKAEWEWMKFVTYDELKAFFEESLPKDKALYNEYHALIVVHSKDICKSTPFCSQCCLRDICEHYHTAGED